MLKGATRCPLPPWSRKVLIPSPTQATPGLHLVISSPESSIPRLHGTGGTWTAAPALAPPGSDHGQQFEDISTAPHVITPTPPKRFYSFPPFREWRGHGDINQLGGEVGGGERSGCEAGCRVKGVMLENLKDKGSEETHC